MYQTGEIVWAKIRGFPWWPAQVFILNLNFLMISLIK